MVELAFLELHAFEKGSTIWMCLSLQFTGVIETIMLLQVFPACTALSPKVPVMGTTPLCSKAIETNQEERRKEKGRVDWTGERHECREKREQK